MPHRLAQQRMTLSDLKWPFHEKSLQNDDTIARIKRQCQCTVHIVHTKINIIRIARYLCGS